MKFEEALIIAEERNGGDFLKFEVQLGEDEGKNIPHFHLDNGEIEKRKRKLLLDWICHIIFFMAIKLIFLTQKKRKLLFFG